MLQTQRQVRIEGGNGDGAVLISAKGIGILEKHLAANDKAAKSLAVKWDDVLVKATLLTRDGAVVHPNFQPKGA